MKKYSIEDLNNRFVEKRSNRFSELPRKIEIETINRCNGKCSFCPVNANEPQRPYAKMSEELFVKIIDELQDLGYRNKISLFSNNEPLLDERIIDWHKYAKEKLYNAIFILYTNGTLLTIEKLTVLMKYCDKIVIDNYSDEGDIHENLIEIKEFLSRNNKYSKKVCLELRKENEVLTSRGGAAPNKKRANVITAKCVLPFQMMVIRPTGEVSLCCNDALGKVTLGDCSRESISEIWFGNHFCEVRNKMSNIGRQALPLCKSCDTLGGDFTIWESYKIKK